MRILLATLLILSCSIVSAASASPQDTFEKNLQQIGRKLDQAKVRGQELSREAKLQAQTEWKNLVANGEKAKANKDDWSARISSATDEFIDGVKSAWKKLKGE